MGCFYETCNISRLAIQENTPVYVFVLQSLIYEQTYKYSGIDAFYSPVLLPFVGDYDDYGSVTNPSGNGINHLVKLLATNIMPMKSSPDYTINAHKDFLNNPSIEAFLDLDTRHIMSYPTSEPISISMIRKDVADSILENYEIYMYFSNKSSHVTFKDLISNIRPFFNYLIELQDTVQTKDEYKSLITNIFTRPKRHSHLILDFIFYNTREGNTTTPIMFDPLNILLSHFLSDTPEVYHETELLLIEITKGFVLNKFMDSIKQVWTPCGTTCDQRSNDGSLLLLNDTVNNIINKQRDEWDLEFETSNRSKYHDTY